MALFILKKLIKFCGGWNRRKVPPNVLIPSFIFTLPRSQFQFPPLRTLIPLLWLQNEWTRLPPLVTAATSSTSSFSFAGTFSSPLPVLSSRSPLLSSVAGSCAAVEVHLQYAASVQPSPVHRRRPPSVRSRLCSIVEVHFQRLPFPHLPLRSRVRRRPPSPSPFTLLATTPLSLSLS